jgi:hypothetical protein
LPIGWRDCTGGVVRVSNGEHGRRSGGAGRKRERGRHGGRGDTIVTHEAVRIEPSMPAIPYERTAMASISTTKLPAMALTATVERAG